MKSFKSFSISFKLLPWSLLQLYSWNPC